MTLNRDGSIIINKENLGKNRNSSILRRLRFRSKSSSSNSSSSSSHHHPYPSTSVSNTSSSKKEDRSAAANNSNGTNSKKDTNDNHHPCNNNNNNNNSHKVAIDTSSVGSSNNIIKNKNNNNNEGRPSQSSSSSGGGLKRFMKKGSGKSSKYKSLDNSVGNILVTENYATNCPVKSLRGNSLMLSATSKRKGGQQGQQGHGQGQPLREIAVLGKNTSSATTTGQQQQQQQQSNEPIRSYASSSTKIIQPKCASPLIGKANTLQPKRSSKKKKRKSFGKDDGSRLLFDQEYRDNVDDDESFETSGSDCSVQKRLKEAEMRNDLHGKTQPIHPFSDLHSTDFMTSHTAKNNSSQSNADSCIPPIECLELTSPLYKCDKNTSLSTSSSTSTMSPTAMQTDAFSGMYFEDDDEADYARSGPAYYNEEGEDDEDDEEEEDDDDDESCDSTVVNETRQGLVRPPPTASKEEQARFYWDLCYGKPPKKVGSEKRAPLPPRTSWSVNRFGPVKSCLSAKKTPWSEIAASASKRRSRTRGGCASIYMNTPSSSLDNVRFEEDKNISMVIATTPVVTTPQNLREDSARRGVKFGCAAAVEFDLTRPICELTPLPAAQARARFPMDEKANESDEESHELHRETARNAAQLAMWDDDFDSYVDGWGEGDADIGEDKDHIEFNENLSPHVTSSEDRRRRNSRDNQRRSREKKDRRSSTFYSKGGESLIQNDDFDHEVKETNSYGHMIDSGGNRTIYVDQKNKVSPLHYPLQNDSVNFSSPSNSNAPFRLSTSASESSKETPKTDVTSSSSLLRSVHSAGGATLSRGSGTTGDDAGLGHLKPNQLDSVLQKAEVTISHDCTATFDEQILPPKLLEGSANATIAQDYGAVLRKLQKQDCFPSHSHNVSCILHGKHSKNPSDESVQQYWNDASLLNIAPDLELSFSNQNTEAFIMARHNSSEVLKMTVSLLEQRLPADKGPKDEKTAYGPVLERFQIQHECNEDEMNECYNLLAQYSYHQWARLEIQAAQMAISWLQPQYEANRKEESALSLQLESVNNCLYHQHILKNKPPYQLARTSRTKRIRKRKLQADKRHEIEKQVRAIESLEACIEKETSKIQRLKNVEEMWYLKCSIERISSSHYSRWLALSSILPFEAQTLGADKVDISFSHMDNLESQTILRWSATKNTDYDVIKSSRRERDSMITLDSLISSESNTMLGLLSRAPEIIRMKKKGDTNGNMSSRVHREGYLPTGSVAHDFYAILLNGDHMKAFITRQFQQEGFGLFTVSDVFQRLALMAKDIMVLQKYYTCRFEIPPRSSNAILHVTICLGQSCSLGLRFTYNLSDERTILYSIPSDVYIMSITGEPAVPINILLRVANSFLAIKPRCNAFILRRTCSAIVDTLQGRT